MSDQRPADNKSDTKHDSISIIYHQRNDSPKYFEVKRSKVFLFFVGLPAVTLIAVIIGVIGLINTSPMKLINNYKETSRERSLNSRQDALLEEIQSTTAENAQLKNDLAVLEAQVKASQAGGLPATTPAPQPQVTTTASGTQCPAPVVCPPGGPSATVNSIGLSTLSLFKPIQGQKDRTRPAILNLSGFKTATGRDTVNLLFNIIPSTTDDTKISGHIVVLMKNELGIQAYPLQTFGGNDFQINYSAGEPFATQRFRPVDASFVKPRRSGNYSFTVFIFSRTGDLIHYQTIIQPIKI